MPDSNETDIPRVSRRTTLKMMGAGTAAFAGLGSLTLSSETVTETAESITETATGNEDWPQFQYNDAKTGHAPNTGPQNDVVMKWQDKVGPFTAGAVVANGMVYASKVATERKRPTTYAWNAETGELHWKFPGGGGFSPPLVYDGTVYTAGPKGLFAMDARTGKLQWRDESKGGKWTTGLIVANDTLYFSAPGMGSERSFSTLFALDPETGEERWGLDIGGHAEGDLAAKDGRVVGVSHGGRVWAVDAESHEEIWRRPVGHRPPVQSAPTVADGKVFLGSGQKHYSYDIETGEKAFDGKHLYSDDEKGDGLGTDDRINTAMGSPVVADGVLYGVTTESVFAIDAESGEVIWKHTDGKVGFGGTWASPVLADGILYVGDNNGRLFGFNAENGNPRFSTRLGSGMMIGAPAVANGNVYVTAWRGSMMAGEDPTKQ